MKVVPLLRFLVIAVLMVAGPRFPLPLAKDQTSSDQVVPSALDWILNAAQGA
jgi:hypothetical protein